MKSFLKTYIVAVASGALMALCFPAYHLFPLAWVALVPLLYRVWNLTSRQSAGHFLVAGLACYLILLQWLMSNVYWAGGWAFWGYVLLSLVMAAYWAVVGWAWIHMKAMLPRVAPALTLALLWGAMEHLQSFAFTGFGWGALGYSQGPDLLLLQWACLGGVPLVAVALVAFNVLIAGSIAEREGRLVRVVCAGIILIGTHSVGWLLLDSPEYGEEPYRVGMIQADFPLEMKWDPEYTLDMVQNTAQKSRMLAQTEPIDLFVWPESLVMDEIDSPPILAEVQSLTRDTGAALLAGAHRSDPGTGGSLNSSYLVSSEGDLVDFYDKIHLAPFGEYVPLSTYLPFVSKVVPAIGDIQPGAATKVFSTDGRALGPLICFEVLFAPMSARLRSDGADLLVVMTNLGWFGASSAIPQELEVARVRAVETRLPLAHCANTGITGMFDPWGRFTLIDTYFDGRGNMYRLEDVSPADTRMNRLGGALPAARPGPHPFPSGPRLLPNIVLVLVGLLAIAAAIRSLRGSSRKT